MSEQTFIGYIQEPDIHDGVIINARYKSGLMRSVFDRREVVVAILTYAFNIVDFSASIRLKVVEVSKPERLRVMLEANSSG